MIILKKRMEKYAKPTLIINENIARNNIKTMVAKAKSNNISFEPHFKTHQSKLVGEWFREEGVEAITVSSISMATYFAKNGWNKITIAFPVNFLEINALIELSNSAQLTLLVQSTMVVKKLDSLKNKVDLLIEVDAGYHRSGIAIEQLKEIEEVVKTIKEGKHKFKGFYYHAGTSYEARGEHEIKSVFDDMKREMMLLKNHFKLLKNPHVAPHIAIGDTPICSRAEDLKEFDSIHPGNFVYYDATQIEIGSCNLEQVATFVSCPVVATYKHRNEWVVYGGGVHLSKESLDTATGKIFGLVGVLSTSGLFTPFKDVFVKSLSQEHGIISSKHALPSEINVGDVIYILPIHSCMTVDCMPEAYTLEGTIIAKMAK